MKEAGFFEIFVNNDAQTPVYYDNMMVVMSGGAAVEVNAYYPSGYNLFSAVKRFESYESFGALFRQTKSEILELNVKERIWLIIKKILIVLANYCEIDIELVTKHILSDNKQLENILNLNILGKVTQNGFYIRLYPVTTSSIGMSCSPKGMASNN